MIASTESGRRTRKGSGGERYGWKDGVRVRLLWKRCGEWGGRVLADEDGRGFQTNKVYAGVECTRSARVRFLIRNAGK